MGNWGLPADTGCLQNFIITIAGRLFNCFALVFTFLTWRVERICLFIRYGLFFICGSIRLQMRKRVISPAGDLLCPCRQSRQSATGGGSRAFDNALSRLPRTPCFFTGGPPRARLYPSGAGKDQDTVPHAARCRSVLIGPTYAPTRAVAPGFLPSRGGSVVALPPGWVVDIRGWLRRLKFLSLQGSFGPLPSVPIPAPQLPGYCHPRGVHPIGGTAVPPVLVVLRGWGI